MTAPAATASIDELERVALRHWMPGTCLRLGPWFLRAHRGITGRANSALALGDPGLEPGLTVRAALDAVRTFYAERGLPPLLSLPVPADAPVPVTGPDSAMPREALSRAVHRGHSSGFSGARQLALRAAIEGCGWRPGGGVSAYTLCAPVAGLAQASATAPSGLHAHRRSTPDDAWLALYRRRGNPFPQAGGDLLVSAPEQAFFSLEDDHERVAVARGSLAEGWAAVTAVEVVPHRRRRGLARWLLAEVARWAQGHRARSMFLQTAAPNRAAHLLYLSSGFTVHHRYDYLTSAEPGER